MNRKIITFIICIIATLMLAGCDQKKITAEEAQEIIDSSKPLYDNDFAKTLDESIKTTNSYMLEHRGASDYVGYEADKPWISSSFGLSKMIYDEEVKQTKIIEENNKLLKEIDSKLK